MLIGDLRLDLFVRDDRALFEVDQQHAARLQPPLGHDGFFGNRQHTGFGRHNDAVVIGDDIARRAQAVAVERGADLLAVGERYGGGAVPRFHERCVILVECLAARIHLLVTGPGFRDQHHHRVGEAVAAPDQKFERVVEAGGVRLAFVGNRPELGDVVAEQFGIDRSLPCRHPVDVAAQRVDLAIMRDHAEGVRQLPRGKSIGGETLVDQCQRGLEALVNKVLEIQADLIGEEHALVDNRARRERDDVEAVVPALGLHMDTVGDYLSHDIEPALIVVVIGDFLGAAKKGLTMYRFAGGDMRRL